MQFRTQVRSASTRLFRVTYVLPHPIRPVLSKNIMECFTTLCNYLKKKRNIQITNYSWEELHRVEFPFHHKSFFAYFRSALGSSCWGQFVCGRNSTPNLEIQIRLAFIFLQIVLKLTANKIILMKFLTMAWSNSARKKQYESRNYLHSEPWSDHF